MSDAQTELGEAIQQQNAPPVSVRLERGESVRWHDGTQWRVGTVLMLNGKYPFDIEKGRLVQALDGLYSVDPDALEPYGPRCERCGGSGEIDYVACANGTIPRGMCPECGGEGVTWTFEDWNPGGHRVTTPCPACGGEGTIISDVSKYLGGESIPCAYKCPECGGSGRQNRA